MNAKLINWYCPEIDDLPNYSPPECDNFSFLFRAMVGEGESKGKDSFDIEICTPKKLLSSMQEGDIVSGRHILFVLHYDYKKILERIRIMIESCCGDDWDEIAEKVGRIGKWEFEDYQEYVEHD